MKKSEYYPAKSLLSKRDYKLVLMDLPHDVTFDTALRYVDHLHILEGVSTFPVAAYFELDARLAWRINKHWLVAIVGDNLLHERHGEFLPTEVQTQRTEIPRSIFAEVTFQL